MNAIKISTGARNCVLPNSASQGRGPGNGGGWPSRTGNPSGGGRSNAPSRGGRK